ncbi:MAG: cofactor [Pseudomonadota bacterium]
MSDDQNQEEQAPVEDAEAGQDSGNDGGGVEVLVDARVEELERQLNDTTARLRAVSGAYKNAQEEMAAYKTRLERQAALKEEIQRGEVVSRLFEPLENLRRTLSAMQRAEIDPSLLQGLELVQRAFLEGFQGLGLQEFGAVGDVFNPDQHEALTTMPVAEERLDGRVAQVFTAGFRVGTRVIRPARVIVGQYTAPAGEA